MRVPGVVVAILVAPSGASQFPAPARFLESREAAAAQRNAELQPRDGRAAPLGPERLRSWVLAAADVTNPDKEALADLTGSVLASLRNHKGKGIERANEGAPARWQLKEGAN